MANPGPSGQAPGAVQQDDSFSDFQKKLQLFRQSGRSEGVTQREWIAERQAHVEKSLADRKADMARAVAQGGGPEDEDIERMRQQKKDLEKLMEEGRKAEDTHASQQSREAFQRKVNSFRVGEDASLSLELSSQDWLAKKHRNVTASLRSREDIKLARLHHETELRAKADAEVKRLEQMKRDLEIAMSVLERDRAKLMEEHVQRRRQTEEAEKLTLAMLMAEKQEAEKKAAEERRYLEQLQREAQEEELAAKRRERDAERSTLELLRREKETFGFGRSEEEVAADGLVALELSRRDDEEDIRRRRQLEEDERLARSLSGGVENPEDAELARQLQKLELQQARRSLVAGASPAHQPVSSSLSRAAPGTPPGSAPGSPARSAPHSPARGVPSSPSRALLPPPSIPASLTTSAASFASAGAGAGAGAVGSGGDDAQMVAPTFPALSDALDRDPQPSVRIAEHSQPFTFV